jgi:hypothetical protein
VSQPLLDSLVLKDGAKYDKVHHQRMVEWRSFLKETLPTHPNRFAIIETCGKRKSWGVKGAIREACGREGITSQMVETIRMKVDEAGNKIYLGGPGNHEHRANSVAHEATLRHIGALLGDPQLIYQAAGINEPNLEVLAFFIRFAKTNLKYPVAVKIAFDGAVEVFLPGQMHWLLYSDAAPTLARTFAGEWRNATFENRKWKIDDKRKDASALWYDKARLSDFVLSVLKSLPHPTIALIEAENWRNFDVWPQLNNQNLPKQSHMLNFSVQGHTFSRTDPMFSNLLAVSNKYTAGIHQACRIC